VTSGGAYDHQCQYMLKDRYNCARNNSDILDYGHNPTDWKLTLVPQEKFNKECNLWDFIHELGGPIGVAETMYTQRPSLTKKQKRRKRWKEIKNKPFVVLMMGNSYLRQVFEALACGWSADISNYRASIGSKACYSLSCVAEHGDRKFRINELGKFGRLPKRSSKKASISKSQFYRPGVALPAKVFDTDITDDLAMVEFGKRIRSTICSVRIRLRV